jgi:hypothetical protein
VKIKPKRYLTILSKTTKRKRRQKMRKSNTKRLTALIIAIVMIMSAVLTGCSGSGKADQEESKE